jgi:hypothetical protein
MNSHRRTAARGVIRMMHGVAVAALLALPAWAQESVPGDTPEGKPNPSAPAATERARPNPIQLGYFRPHDARGLNVFEPPKQEGVPYDGFRLMWGAAFTQQFQALRHSNNATPVIVGGVNQTKLIDIGSGFNNADANLYMDAQLARGVRVALTSYMSSRHHNEMWVKDGYLLIDGSPWENATLDRLMKNMTLRLGHFEINYGDMHFRRTDNGQAMFNPLVGNLLMDAFTTEIGGEVYLRGHDLLGMAAVTGGEVRGQVLKPEQRSPSYMGKLGFDKELNADTRVRLTGSVYTTTESISNTLYTGSRAGSRYYYVIENTLATESAQAWSGDVRPDFSKRVTAFVVNPFVRWKGLELFGNVEQARGRTAAETSLRTWHQYAGEGVYRFAGSHLYAAARYNVAKGRPLGIASDVSVDRTQVGGGWFLTTNLSAKGEYVRQTYNDYPANDIHHDARFQGVMVEAVVSF